MKLRIKKMHGCGNDFLFLDYMVDEPPHFYPTEIQALCHRQFGVGADGLVILQASKEADAAWKFYNCDGTEAEMCGNAARCAIRYLSDRHISGEEAISLQTRAGILRGKKVSDDMVEVTLFPQGDVKFVYEEKILTTERNVFNVFCINTGVPHAVLEVKDLYSYPIAQVGRLIQKHAAFQPAETNVTFFQRLVGNHIRSTTYERGVEKETFACGTGAAAAAIIYAERYLQGFPVEVSVPGGQLTCDISPISKVFLLRGPTEYVFDIEVNSPPTSFESPALFGERRRTIV